RHTRSKRDWSSDVCSSDLRSFIASEKNPIRSSRVPTDSKENALVGSNFATTIASCDRGSYTIPAPPGRVYTNISPCEPGKLMPAGDSGLIRPFFSRCGSASSANNTGCCGGQASWALVYWRTTAIGPTTRRLCNSIQHPYPNIEMLL